MRVRVCVCVCGGGGGGGGLYSLKRRRELEKASRWSLGDRNSVSSLLHPLLSLRLVDLVPSPSDETTH